MSNLTVGGFHLETDPIVPRLEPFIPDVVEHSDPPLTPAEVLTLRALCKIADNLNNIKR